MTSLTVTLKNVQHVKLLRYAFDLTHSGLTAIVGKNGAGKSTLARALRMLSVADTFEKTASGSIFRLESSIEYVWSGQRLAFTYDPSLRSLNCREAISPDWRALVSCELSIPHGERFNFFRSISGADLDIRRALIMGRYAVPSELIDFLRAIYVDKNFDDLVEIRIKRAVYYCIRKPDDRYLREDYFSSGEYFLVSLYRHVLSGFKLIFIDEIDISLDASAQVRLVTELRKLCTKYQVRIAFTTHSLAMMKTLAPDELNFMEASGDEVMIKPASYNFLKSLLYGFRGWDRYILTEDEVLKDFLEHVIARYCRDLFFRYIIIYVGGGGNVTDMLRRNAAEGFFAESSNVVAVLDGDQSGTATGRVPGTRCIPIDSVEKALHDLYLQPSFQPRLANAPPVIEPKILFKRLIKQRLMTRRQVFDIVCDAHDADMHTFAHDLQLFLSP